MASLEEALRSFDTVTANLVKAEKLWKRIEALLPDGIVFLGSSPEARSYEDLCRAFDDLAGSLPAIDGWKIMSRPLELDQIAQWRFDSQELGEPEALLAVERGIVEPERDLQEYRFKLNRKRRELVRSRLGELITTVDDLLAFLTERHREALAKDSVQGPEWDRLDGAIKEVVRLLGGDNPRGKWWNDLHRHLAFAQVTDLRDIAARDWPKVRSDIHATFFDETEPIPVDVEDLGALVAARPPGPVSSKLRWEVLSDEGFERLVFSLISDAAGYENPLWLTQTRAPDRGRDLSVDRVVSDPLGSTKRRRVIIQCKHWLKKSVSVDEIATACAQMQHWEPPVVDALVLASSGRFTTDAVDWIEKHNHGGKRPELEMWPESHLERLLAQRPHLVAEFGLR